MTPEERLREMVEKTYGEGCSEKPWLEAGADALAITRAIAESSLRKLMITDNEGFYRCCYCEEEAPYSHTSGVIHKGDCLYLRCVILHDKHKP